MVCSFCKSDNFYLKQDGDKTGLYCRDCNRWLKWVTPAEKSDIEREIERKKREIVIDGADYDRVLEKYRNYKSKYNALTEEIKFFNNTKSKSEIQTKAAYDKVLKLKEYTAKITAYDEIITILRLKR